MEAVILCGGKGTRLQPYTTVLPKPLVPVGDRPILEILIRQLAGQGVKRCRLAVGHLAELLEAYFGDGSRFGVEIIYHREDKPLGTAGPLAGMDGLEETFLVMNGDLLTDLKIEKLISFHHEKKALSTIATYTRNVQIQLGVLGTDEDNLVQTYTEKPCHQYRVSMGIYVFNRQVIEYIPKDKRFDFPELVNALLNDKKIVAACEHEGYWKDIGNREDCEAAQADFMNNSERFL